MKPLLSIKKVADSAKALGVSVNILTIQGTNTSLELIAEVAVQTKGYNHIVDPLKLTKNFNFILQNNVIATDVVVEMFLHKCLRFKHEDNVNNNRCARDVGNVNKESSLTFEYVIHDKEKIGTLTHLPFQIQIKYNKVNGAKCLRVMSNTTKITSDRQQAEKTVNVGVIGLHSQLQAAKLAADGNYTKARMVQKSNMRMVRNALLEPDVTEQQQKQYSLWNKEAVRLNDAIKKENKEEDLFGLNYHSAGDDASDNDDIFNDKKPEKEKEKEKDKEKEKEVAEKEEKEKKEKKKQKEERKQARKVRRAQKDDLSNVLHQAQNPLFSAFTEKANPMYSDD